MKIPFRFRELVPAVLLSCFAVGAAAQQWSQQQPDLPALSSPIHSALYPEVMCVHCVIPQWDRGYILHREFDKDPAVVTMYDRDGKQVLEARMQPPDAAQISVSAAAATHAGGILAVGGGIMTDGSMQGFIAKSDLTGHIIQSLRTGQFSPHQVCEASDGTVWTLGYPRDYRDSPDADKNVLRHYSFEKGPLESLIAFDSIFKSRDTILNVVPGGPSFLRCSKDRVSVFFGSAARYIEVDASNGKIARWNVALAPIAGGRATGFAVTEEGRIFVSFMGFGGPDNTDTHGLYELKAKAGISVATLVPVDGTLMTHERGGVPPDEMFERLWGADGDQLVIQRYGDGWGISWANIVASSSPSD